MAAKIKLRNGKKVKEWLVILGGRWITLRRRIPDPIYIKCPSCELILNQEEAKRFERGKLVRCGFCGSKVGKAIAI